MRRKDREITDRSKIEQIISTCYCCRIGFNDKGKVYIVPLNFGFISEDGKYTFYFHGAKEGRKIDLIRENPEVGFELDTNYKLREADVACGCSCKFQSVIGNGIMDFVVDAEEKQRGLIEIMKHNTGKADWTFAEKMLDEVCVFKLVVESMACKEHL